MEEGIRENKNSPPANYFSNNCCGCWLWSDEVVNQVQEGNSSTALKISAFSLVMLFKM
jgi:hypothetical protein